MILAGLHLVATSALKERRKHSVLCAQSPAQPREYQHPLPALVSALGAPLLVEEIPCLLHSGCQQIWALLGSFCSLFLSLLLSASFRGGRRNSTLSKFVPELPELPSAAHPTPRDLLCTLDAVARGQI